MKKLTLTTGALTLIAGSALLAGIAFGSDSMRAVDGRNDVTVAAAMTKPADVDNDTVDRDKDIADEQKVDSDDVDEANDQDVDSENDEDASDTADVDNDADKANDKDKTDSDRNDTTKADNDKDDHGQAVSAVASMDRHGEKHSNRGR